MPRGISLHVGVAEPGGGCCGGKLFPGAAEVAGAYAELAADAGFVPRPLLAEADATRAAVLVEICRAACELQAGDIFLFTFCGHGCQVHSRGDDAERDGFDETMCLADGQLVDDDLHAALMMFGEGVRVLIIADSCHSASVASLPAMAMANAADGADGADGADAADSADAAMAARVARVARLREDGWTPPATAESLLLARRPPRAKPRASVLMMAGCQDHQSAIALEGRGLFSTKLLEVWDGGRYLAKGTYWTFIEAVSREVSAQNGDQHPGMIPFGASCPAFESQRPFTI